MAFNSKKKHLLKNIGPFHILFLNDKNEKEYFKRGEEKQVSSEVYNKLIDDCFVKDLTRLVIEQAKSLKDTSEDNKTA